MTALYKQVCDDILARIEAGSLKVGDKLPPEADYAAELGVSRSTLRLAFGELERVGVLRRKKRVGTEIIADKPRPQFNMNTAGLTELLSLGRDTEMVITGTGMVPSSVSLYLDDERSETGHWLEIRGTRSLPGEARPFNSTCIYVPARYAGIEPVLRPAELSIFEVIERTFGVAIGRVSQSATAIACPPEVSATIGLAPGAPALRIVAELFGQDGSLMEISVATFDPARFQLRTDVEVD